MRRRRPVVSDEAAGIIAEIQAIDLGKLTDEKLDIDAKRELTRELSDAVDRLGDALVPGKPGSQSGSQTDEQSRTKDTLNEAD